LKEYVKPGKATKKSGEHWEWPQTNSVSENWKKLNVVQCCRKLKEGRNQVRYELETWVPKELPEQEANDCTMEAMHKENVDWVVSAWSVFSYENGTGQKGQSVATLRVWPSLVWKNDRKETHREGGWGG
jgi:hypothetical protein